MVDLSKLNVKKAETKVIAETPNPAPRVVKEKVVEKNEQMETIVKMQADLIQALANEKAMVKAIWKDAITFFRKVDATHSRKEQEKLKELMNALLGGNLQ